MEQEAPGDWKRQCEMNRIEDGLVENMRRASEQVSAD